MKKIKDEKKNYLFIYELKGDIYAKDIEEATDIIQKIGAENKDCFHLKHISIQR